MGTADNRSYSAGFFQLALDGEQTTAYLKSVEGGLASHEAVRERFGEHNKWLIHSSLAEIKPIKFEFGASGAEAVMKWIKKSMDKDPVRRSGQIDYGNFNTKIMLSQEFHDALITEVTFPTLDGGAKDAGYIKVGIQPWGVKLEEGSGKLDPRGGLKQKLWNTSCFRLNIDGIDTRHVSKVESFTVKQTVKKLYAGPQRFPEVEPANIELPNLVAWISSAHAQDIFKWHEDFIANGMNDPSAMKNGSLDYLSPDRQKVLFSIQLRDLMLVNISGQRVANSSEISRVRFEMVVEDMVLDGNFGFDG